MESNKKNELRTAMLQRRAALDPETRLRAAEAAAGQALHLFQTGNVVALYWPVRNELSPLIFAEYLQALQTALCLPVVIEPGAPLQFRKWQAGDLLHKGRYGIDEPPHTSPFVTPDILIVPLLAFDRNGMRLGTGGGYYDRTLESLRRADAGLKAYGYAFSCQENATLPAEPHDQSLDGIITEKEVVLF